jgi:hypothetical protein
VLSAFQQFASHYILDFLFSPRLGWDVSIGETRKAAGASHTLTDGPCSRRKPVFDEKGGFPQHIQDPISESLSRNKLPQTIRDACRQDPTVPKNVLVEIAFSFFLLLRGGPDHADRIHERTKGHPRTGHQPGGEEQEKPM